MGESRIPLIAGNWKMNFDHLQAIAFVQKLSWTLGDVKHNFSSCEVAIFPPFTDLRSVQTLLSADKLALRLGAQDVSQFEPGAFTGDIAASFLAKLDVTYVLVGHSERRSVHGDSDSVVNAKTLAATAAGLIPIVCVGETEEDRKYHGASAIPSSQLEAAIESLGSEAEIVVAYEPIWAIGSGEAATTEQVQEVASALRKTLAEKLGADRARVTRILYGGSVKSDNVAGFMRVDDIDGVLVGGASLDVEEFARIAQYQKHVLR